MQGTACAAAGNVGRYGRSGTAGGGGGGKAVVNRPCVVCARAARACGVWCRRGSVNGTRGTACV